MAASVSVTGKVFSLALVFSWRTPGLLTQGDTDFKNEPILRPSIQCESDRTNSSCTNKREEKELTYFTRLLITALHHEGKQLHKEPGASHLAGTDPCRTQGGPESRTRIPQVTCALAESWWQRVPNSRENWCPKWWFLKNK